MTFASWIQTLQIIGADLRAPVPPERLGGDDLAVGDQRAGIPSGTGGSAMALL